MKSFKLVILLFLTIILMLTPYSFAESRKLTVSMLSGRYQIETLRQLARVFERKHGMKINITDHTASVKSVMSAVATGQIDIIVGVPHHWLPGLALTHSIYPLSDYFTKKEVDNFLDIAIQAWSFNQELYGIPISIDTSLLIVNENLVEQPPETWNDLVNIAKTKGFLFDAQTLEGIWPFFSAYGVDEEDLYEKTFEIATPEALRAVKFVQEIGKEEIINLEHANALDSQKFFREQTVGMIIGGSWLVDDFLKKGLGVKVIPIPKPPDAKRPKPFSFVDAIVLNNYSKEKDIAVEFIKEITLVNEKSKELWLGNFWAPPRKDILEQTWWKSNYPIAAKIAEQVRYSQPFPNMSEAGYSWEPVDTALFDILHNQKTQDEARKDLTAAENEVIKQIKSFGD